MDIWQTIFSELDHLLTFISEQGYNSGAILKKSKIKILKILGQCSLLVQPDVAIRLFPTATKDLDGLIEGEFVTCRNELKKVLRKYGLVYDDLSKEIWLPENATFNQIYDGQKLEVLALDPISALVSKAVKAPDKNYSLIKRGLEIFGSKLSKELERYNISTDKFAKEPDFGI